MSQHSILQISSGIPSGLMMWRRATIVHQIISAAMMVTVCRCGAAVTRSHSAMMAPMRLGVTNQKQVRHPMETSSSGLQLNLNAASLVERTVSCKSIALLQDTCCMQLCGIVGCHSVSSLINVYCWWNCPLYKHHFVCWVLHPWWNCPCSTISFFDEWCIVDETVFCQIITFKLLKHFQPEETYLGMLKILSNKRNYWHNNQFLPLCSPGCFRSIETLTKRF